MLNQSVQGRVIDQDATLSMPAAAHHTAALHLARRHLLRTEKMTRLTAAVLWEQYHRSCHLALDTVTTDIDPATIIGHRAPLPRWSRTTENMTTPTIPVVPRAELENLQMTILGWKRQQQ